MPKIKRIPKKRVVDMFLNVFHKFTFKKAFLTASFFVLSSTLASSCSQKTNNTAPLQQKNTPEPYPPRGIGAEEPDEKVNPEIISFSLTSSAFLFSSDAVKLKKGAAKSKVVELVFKGGFEENDEGVVQIEMQINDTDGRPVLVSVKQGPACTDKHGSKITNTQFKGNQAVLTTDEQKFERAESSTATGVSECYKQRLKPTIAAKNRPNTADLGIAPGDSTIVSLAHQTDHAKNSDAELVDCSPKKQLKDHTLKAKVSITEEGKLKIEFWDDQAGEPDTDAVSQTGLAKIKKALGLKKYHKDKVSESIKYPHNPLYGADANPHNAEGQCFKFLYARQYGVKDYALVSASADDLATYVPPSSALPTNATISAQATMKSRTVTGSDPRPVPTHDNNFFFVSPHIIVKYSNKEVTIGTRALEYLLQSIDSNIFNFAGGSKEDELVTAMGRLVELLDLSTAQ